LVDFPQQIKLKKREEATIIGTLGIRKMTEREEIEKAEKAGRRQYLVKGQSSSFP
jgi:hypothetical protein